MNFKKVVTFLLFIIYLNSFSALKVSETGIKIEENAKWRKEVHEFKSIVPINKDVDEEREFVLKVEKNKHKSIKTLYTNRKVKDNKKGKIREKEKKLEKVYQMITDFNKEGKVNKIIEKSYLINLKGEDFIMYVPIKTIKSTYKYYSKKERKKREKSGIMTVEKFYKKIFYGSGEKASNEFEKIIKKIIPESHIESYNTLDLGFMKEIIKNEDSKEIFFRGKVEFQEGEENE